MATGLSEADDFDLKNLLNEWNLTHHYKYFLGKFFSNSIN